MSRQVGSTSTILVSVADLQRVIRHFSPSHISVGRAWLNSVLDEPPAVAVIPKRFGAKIQNSRRR